LGQLSEPLYGGFLVLLDFQFNLLDGLFVTIQVQIYQSGIQLLAATYDLGWLEQVQVCDANHFGCAIGSLPFGWWSDN